jgi:hypothetical protein
VPARSRTCPGGRSARLSARRLGNRPAGKQSPVPGPCGLIHRFTAGGRAEGCWYHTLLVPARHVHHGQSGRRIRAPARRKTGPGDRQQWVLGWEVRGRHANFQGNPYNWAAPGPSLKQTAKFGSYPANPWGLHDTHGNVFEWCRDWYHAELPGGTDPDLSDKTAASRVRRGGCSADDGWPCRSAFRLRFEPERRHDHVGFRVVAVGR